MKKTKNKISPGEAVRFLEDMRLMAEGRDEATRLISLRIPENILRAIKTKAKAEDKKYQSLIISYLRQALKNN